MANSTAVKNNLKPLAAVEKNSEILHFFQLRIRILRYCGNKMISETLAAVEKNLNFHIFSTAA